MQGKCFVCHGVDGESSSPAFPRLAGQHARYVERQLADDRGRFVFLHGNPYSGVAACSTCHGPNGAGTDSLPRLAGQHAQYTENQLRAFNKRERSNDNAVMHAIASKLSELELKSVAAYISGLE